MVPHNPTEFAKRMIVRIAAISYMAVYYASAFQPLHHTFPQARATTTTTTTTTSSTLFYNSENNDSGSNNNDEVFDIDTLEQRIGHLRLKIMEEDVHRPPNANLSPNEFVKAVLEGIFYNEDPRPDAGYMLLLRCSTDKWATQVLKSIGAPQSATLDMAASALGAAIGRPHNQYAILIGGAVDASAASDNDNNENSYFDRNGDDPSFFIHFPGETLDFMDGTAWMNVEFRSKEDNSLLVLMGWQLWQRPDGAWLVDQIDWQDYRDEFFPGIGREEWMPYEGCGRR